MHRRSPRSPNSRTAANFAAVFLFRCATLLGQGRRRYAPSGLASYAKNRRELLHESLHQLPLGTRKCRGVIQKPDQNCPGFLASCLNMSCRAGAQPRADGARRVELPKLHPVADESVEVRGRAIKESSREAGLVADPSAAALPSRPARTRARISDSTGRVEGGRWKPPP